MVVINAHWLLLSHISTNGCIISEQTPAGFLLWLP